MNRSGRSVVVTGSSGRLGSAIATLLVDRGWCVTGIDRVPGPRTTVVADITTRGLFRRVLAGIDSVIHTASLHVPDLCRHSEWDFHRVNVSATEQLLETAVRAGVRCVVYTSTTSVYGHAVATVDRAVFVREDLSPVPRDIYDSTKLAAERVCREAAASNLRVTCLRVSRFFPEPPFPWLVHRLHRGVDLTDAAEAHHLALGRNGGRFEIFNISARPSFTESDARMLAGKADRIIARRFPDAPAVLARYGWTLPTHIDRVYVIDKAVRALGFRPRRNFRQLLDDLAIGRLSIDTAARTLRTCA